MGGKNDNITKEQAEKLAELGVQRLICGHDHEPHDIEFVNGMAVHRFGNLIRKNRKSYNSHRQIEVMLYDFETNNYVVMLKLKHYNHIYWKNRYQYHNPIKFQQNDFCFE
jgi:hypothetical protein